MIHPAIIASHAAKHELSLEDAEASIHASIHKVCASLSAAKSFGSYTPEDLYQFAYMRALEILAGDKFDPAKPIENFLWGHLRRRISNLVRSEVWRAEPPCKCCDEHTAESEECVRRRAWRLKNESKYALAGVAEAACEPTAPEVDLAANLDAEDLGRYILDRLPPELAADWEAFKLDKLDRWRRDHLQRIVQEIVRLSPYCPPDEAPSPMPTPEPTPEPMPVSKVQPAKRYAHDGLELTLAEWSTRLGVKEATLRMRLRRGRPPEEIFSPEVDARRRRKPDLTGLFEEPKPAPVQKKPAVEPPKKRPAQGRLYQYKGAEHTVAELARLGGLPPSTITSRIKAGWSVEAAVDTQPVGKHRSRPRKPRKPKAPKQEAQGWSAWAALRRLGAWVCSPFRRTA